MTHGQPSHLPALVRWFMLAAQDDIPVRIHSRETAENGNPEWHARFRAWLMAHPRTFDRDGDVISPFRFWLFVMKSESRQGRVAAEFLYRLACLDGDWLEACRTITPLTEDGEVMARAFAVTSLQVFWRRMQSTPRRFVSGPDKSEAQHAAESGA